MKKLISLSLFLAVACSSYIQTEAREIRVRPRKNKSHRHIHRKMKHWAPYIAGAALITIVGGAGFCCLRRGVRCC